VRLRGGGDGAWAARLPGGAEGGVAGGAEGGVASSGGRPRRGRSGQRTAPARQQPLAARRTARWERERERSGRGERGGRRLGDRRRLQGEEAPWRLRRGEETPGGWQETGSWELT
jgi:hypothetical protein